MGDIIAKVLIMSVFMFFIGLIIHVVKYIFDPSYRKEISDKKILKKQLTEFLIDLENSNSEELIKKLSLIKSFLNYDLKNYKEFVLNNHKNEMNGFPKETDLYACINVSIYLGAEYELKNCLNDLIKKHMSEKIESELKFGLDILKKQSELKEKYSKHLNYKLISTYNTYLFKYDRILKQKYSELTLMKEGLFNINSDVVFPNFDNILDRLNNENGYELFLIDLLKNKKYLEEIANLSINIDVYEKITLDLTKNIENLIIAS